MKILLVTGVLLLALCSVGEAVRCISCNHTVLEILEERIEDGDPQCDDNADDRPLSDDDCDACVLITVSYKIEYMGVEGHARSTVRGCTDQWNPETDEECYDDVSELQTQVNEALRLANMTTHDWEGSQCFCDDEDGCNAEEPDDDSGEDDDIECYTCTWSDNKKVRKRLPGTSADCEDNFDNMQTQKCAAGQVCATGVFSVTSYDSLRKIDAMIGVRGCVDKPRDDDDDSSSDDDCSSATDGKDALAAMLDYPRGVEFPDVDGGICYCDDGDHCNDHYTDDVLPPEPTDAPGLQCITCTAIDGPRNKKQNKKRKKMSKKLSNTNNKCINEAPRMTQIGCEEDELCAAIVINSTMFGGIEADSHEIYVRDCIDRALVERLGEAPPGSDGRLNECYHGNVYEGAMEALFGEQFDYQGSSVCICDWDGCNDWTRTDLLELRPITTPAPIESTSPIESTTTPIPDPCLDSVADCLDRAKHAMCGTYCSQFIDCSKETTTPGNCGKKKRFDVKSRKCLKKKKVQCNTP